MQDGPGQEIISWGLNTASEFGHQCNCGKKRGLKLEDYAVGPAIVSEDKKITGMEKLLQKHTEKITVKDAFNLVLPGNMEALQITENIVFT